MDGVDAREHLAEAAEVVQGQIGAEKNRETENQRILEDRNACRAVDA